uniref:Uncharacterized protein n=1 Tax=Chromera velia CCMP2878 TaxID=1169474 RepID=A0A0G4H071_9ALVE|eukprot:Cvel_5499.t1-p1 / transcript=Cvel_5499.t1 / gene=Cvel_5499 / organism=Chromera_velia_CCMP2878 / gene_product=hypothetical protein / transcript_product=hypothetical protein / location=Cvel_scaffold257:65907-66783(+) / protein_length=204 / sequence_SO=supercontig / SO=protein_coding / is_pseudo=false
MHVHLKLTQEEIDGYHAEVGQRAHQFLTRVRAEFHTIHDAIMCWLNSEISTGKTIMVLEAMMRFRAVRDDPKDPDFEGLVKMMDSCEPLESCKDVGEIWYGKALTSVYVVHNYHAIDSVKDHWMNSGRDLNELMVVRSCAQFPDVFGRVQVSKIDAIPIPNAPLALDLGAKEGTNHKKSFELFAKKGKGETVMVDLENHNRLMD